MTDNRPTLPPSRAAALAALDLSLPVNGKPGQDLQAAVDQLLRPLEDPRDRRLATELAYGYMRLRGRLDHLVRLHLDKPVRTHPMLVRILGLAAYELVQLRGVPDHATLSWAVDAASLRLGPAQAKVANAVLRRIQALGEDAANRDLYSPSARTPEEELATWFSCPEWIVRSWMKDYGPEATLELLKGQLLPPLTGLRVNASRPSAPALFDALVNLPGVVSAEFPWVSYTTGGGSGGSSGGGPGLSAEIPALEREGMITRQSPAVGQVLARLGYRDWDGPVWDACAGRGGKTTALLESGIIEVWASDINARRLRGLTTELRRLDLPVIPLFRADASMPPLSAPPRTILVDAPCSGLGVLSRRPDSKWKRTPVDVTTLSAIQERIIRSACALLPRGGQLVYLTCTATRAENDSQGRLIESLGLKPKRLANVGDPVESREVFWGGVWAKNET